VCSGHGNNEQYNSHDRDSSHLIYGLLDKRYGEEPINNNRNLKFSGIVINFIYGLIMAPGREEVPLEFIENA
jgi:hypothetical protein